MVLEGIVTTVDAAGTVNLAPMGPLVDEALTSFLLRPYRTSRTYQNLKQQPHGVIHVTDDVLLLARAAIGRLDEMPELFPAERVPGWVVASACRWYEFEIETLDDAQDRTQIQTRIVHQGRIRDFFGFNRAKHAVLEAAILATRINLMPRAELLEEFERLKIPVQKTAGDSERAAFELLWDYVTKCDAAETAPRA
jgi:hypothetical protein